MGGQLAIVLHAHLPFVRHPEHADFLEEDWLYEGISETYLPLLDAFFRLADEGVPYRLTMTLSPTLVSMLQDELLMSRYRRRLEKLEELADREVARTRGDRKFGPLARFYQQRVADLQRAFVDRYRQDLVSAFRSLRDQGHLEIVTSCATHGFLPLMQPVPQAVRAQVSIGAEHHRRAFGKNPPGFWLPECGYYPGAEAFLAAEELGYFFVDAHGLMDATPRPLYGVYAPVFTESGVAAFGRDPESSRQVWSKEVGYPGDPWYREFYRDIGWDLDLNYIRPYVQPTGERKSTGFKYFRITGSGERKEPYEPLAAAQRAVAHAEDFQNSRERQIARLVPRMEGRSPLLVCPYDAELFGHWWYEGPLFLESLLRRSASPGCSYVLATPSGYLREYPQNQLVRPAFSSWGEKGYAAMWLDESNDWIYRHLYVCAQKMVALAGDFQRPSALEKRALNQAARELLLAQSSDWAFIMRTGTMVDYAVKRTQSHLARFRRLEKELAAGALDARWLFSVETADNLFPEIDYRIYRA